jgi:nitroimidazol reductase NimA-like FMN-containing flavoprotein (pyridoxamine 5'-phosphate oxidase superfamily)
MSHIQPHDIASILRDGKDLTVATLRADGAPQATVVSYASEGLRVYFGCGLHSQKAMNLAADDRLSITITLPYADWSQIQGLSLFGRARRLENPDDLAHVGELFFEKFPEVAQYVAGDEPPAMFEVTPQVISVLDYSKGFGHTELVRVLDAAGEGRIEPLGQPAPA